MLQMTVLKHKCYCFIASLAREQESRTTTDSECIRALTILRIYTLCLVDQPTDSSSDVIHI